ncbi:MAG: DsbA family protein [Alphaproteobacteria bacterium]
MRLLGFRGAALGLSLVMAPMFAAPPAVAAEFSAEQRQAIETIVRDYLLRNPEVMIEVLEAAKEKIAGEAQAQRVAALAERWQEIFEDPNAPVAGNPKGDVTLVEFFDYRCPYCKQVAPAIEALLAEDKQLRVVYKEFPVLGPESVTAARAALAAGKQGKYEALHRALMQMKGQINETAIFNAAKSAGIDVERLKRDMNAPEIDRMLQANQQLAMALDIRGTPAFIVGDEIVPGAVSADALRQLIATARQEKEKGQSGKRSN